MCAGGFAGFMSVVGYRYVQAKVEAWGFHDTCGVHNLHGIPGVIGSLVGVIATAILANTKESELAQMPHGTSQWAFQLAGSVISFAIAVVRPPRKPLRWSFGSLFGWGGVIFFCFVLFCFVLFVCLFFYVTACCFEVQHGYERL